MHSAIATAPNSTRGQKSGSSIVTGSTKDAITVPALASQEREEKGFQKTDL